MLYLLLVLSRLEDGLQVSGSNPYGRHKRKYACMLYWTVQRNISTHVDGRLVGGRLRDHRDILGGRGGIGVKRLTTRGKAGGCALASCCLAEESSTPPTPVSIGNTLVLIVTLFTRGMTPWDRSAGRVRGMSTMTKDRSGLRGNLRFLLPLTTDIDATELIGVSASLGTGDDASSKV